MNVFSTIEEWINTDRASPKKSRGFVPTMGALHAGHAALIERSCRENDETIVSIFVNPTQFNDPKDLENYPRPLDSDLLLLRELGVDVLLAPNASEMYPDSYRYRIDEKSFSTQMEGAHRLGHFSGMLTVVMKLLQLAQADRAYFGEKDFQQLELVRGMAQAFFMRTEIVGCSAVRDSDGLALSSRNRLLPPEERARAAAFPKLLALSLSPQEIRRALEDSGFEVDYVEEREGRRFGAVRIGGVRLIDNKEICNDSRA